MANVEELVGEFDWERNVFSDNDPERRTIVGLLIDGTVIKGKAKRGALQYGLTYRFSGRWTNHPKWGRQFHFNGVTLSQPAGQRGVTLYLSRAAGIGPAIAQAIWDAFGDESVRILREDPERVADTIPGLSVETAHNAAKMFALESAIESTMVELIGLLAKRGFPKTLPERCYAQWGASAPDVIRENPYALANFHGVGFLLCDRLYLELGGDPAAINRQGMCLWHAVRSNTEGHTWHRFDTIAQYLKQSISGADLAPEKALDWAVENNLLVTRTEAGCLWVAEARLAAHESRIADCIRESEFETPVWPAIQWSDDEDDGLPTRHQAEELAKAQGGVIGILLGSPGTGKTFTVAHQIKAVGANPDRVAVCAPTGKAAVRITESMAEAGLNLQAKTIHSTLGVVSVEGGWVFAHNEHCPLEFDYIFVDEASMIDVPLMSALLAARGHAHMMLTGDPDQLSPVGPGAPLRDLVAAGVPHGHLKEIHRNAGTIVRACAMLRDKGTLFWDDELDLSKGKNLIHIETTKPEQTIDEIRQILAQAEVDGRDPVWDCQVLVPVNKKSPLGRTKLNEWLQGLLNPLGKQAKGNPFREGDKIVCTRNGDLPKARGDKKRGDDSEQVRVMNGELAAVTHVAERYLDATVMQLPLQKVRIPRGQAKDQDGDGDDDTDTGCNFELGYSLSVHKSQGSQFAVSIVVIDPYPGARMLCDRHWIYTAISRATDFCITIGHKAHALEACRKSHMWKRRTFLREMLDDLRCAEFVDAWEKVC